MKWLITVASALAVSSCTFMRSSGEPLAKSTLVDSGSACALVLLPGLGDDPALFKQFGFDEAVKASRAPCDVLAVDSHFGYYRDAVLVDRLAVEVLGPIRRRYERVWLVGVSLGGYGAVLAAQAHPELVDGVVLISPFLGLGAKTRTLVARIEAAGGLARYDGPFAEPTHPRRHFLEVEPLWRWLAERARRAPGPKVVIAWGSEDAFVWKHRAFGSALEPRDAIERSGGHDWSTFSALWKKVVSAAPWSKARDEPYPELVPI